MRLSRVGEATAKVASDFGKHFAYQRVVSPPASRAFVRAIANTIHDTRTLSGWTTKRIKNVTLEEFCPSIERMAFSIEVPPRETYELPLIELVHLGAMLRYFRPMSVFEIGTFKGRTTRLLAEMTDNCTCIYTLDLPPAEVKRGGYFSDREGELIGQDVQESSCREKITQLYGNSRKFDFSPFYGQMDFVFIDGDHSYEGVKSDTQNALRMIRPGGVIVWDDYSERHTPGVVQCLEELSVVIEVFRLAGTRFGCHRAKTP